MVNTSLSIPTKLLLFRPEKECDILLTDALSSCLFNTSIMIGFLLESLSTQALANDGEESDDPEVQFPFFPNKTSPAKVCL
jgi:hypothetical protein